MWEHAIWSPTPEAEGTKVQAAVQVSSERVEGSTWRWTEQNMLMGYKYNFLKITLFRKSSWTLLYQYGIKNDDNLFGDDELL